MQLKRERIRKFPGNSLMDPGSDDPGRIRKFPCNFLIHPRVRGMDVLVLKVGPQVKPMPDMDIFVGAMMGKNIVLELPESCRGG